MRVRIADCGLRIEDLFESVVVVLIVLFSSTPRQMYESSTSPVARRHHHAADAAAAAAAAAAADLRRLARSSAFDVVTPHVTDAQPKGAYKL